MRKTPHHVCTPDCGPHICRGCGQEFAPKRSDQSACSRKCSADSRGICSTDGCDRRVIARGMCDAHYRRWKDGRDPSLPIKGTGAICATEGCERPAKARGLCEMHRTRLLSTGDVGVAHSLRPPQGDCSVSGCVRKARSRGLCGMHFQRLASAGDVGPPHPVKRATGQGSLSNGYIDIQVNGKRMLQHRIVMEGIIGRPLAKHETVHHRNGIRADNRPENLELFVMGHPYGQRPEDLIAFVVENYPDAVGAALRGEPRALWLPTPN